MSLHLSVESGGEKWVAHAKKKLAQLKATMRRAGIMALSQWIQLDTGDRIFLNSLRQSYDDLDKIRIFSRATGGFLVLPKIKKPDTTILTGVNRLFIPLSLDRMSVYPLTVSNVSYYPFVSGKNYLTGARLAANYGYLTNQTFVGSGGGGSSSFYGVVKYNEVVYRIFANGEVYPLNSLTPVTGSTALGYIVPGIFSKLGDKVIAFHAVSGYCQLDTLTFSTDSEGTVSVAYNVTPYTVLGTEREVASNVVVGDADYPVLPYAATIDTSDVITHSIDFPVCMSLKSDNTLSQITATEVYSYSDVTHHAEGLVDISSANTYSDTRNKQVSKAVTFTFISGATHTVDLTRISLISSGSGVFNVGPATGSGSLIYTDFYSSVSVYFASAEWNALIYHKHDIEQTNTQISSEVGGAGITTATSSYDVITRDTINIVLDGTVNTIYTEEAITASGGAIDNISAWSGGISNSYSSGSDTTTDVLVNPYFSAERKGDGSREFARAITGEYLGSLDYTDQAAAHRYAVFSSKSDLTDLKLAVVNRVLFENDPRGIIEADIATLETSIAALQALVTQANADLFTGGDLVALQAIVDGLNAANIASLAAKQAELASTAEFMPIADASGYEFWFSEIRLV